MHALEVGSLRSQSMSGIKPIPSSRYLALTNDDLIFGNTIETFCYLTYEIIKLFILIPGNEKFVSDFQSKKSYFCKFCQPFYVRLTFAFLNSAVMMQNSCHAKQKSLLYTWEWNFYF